MRLPSAVLTPILLFSAAAQTPPSLIDVMSAELVRNFAVLSEKADPKPYYLSYSITEEETASVTASLGSLTSTTANHTRTLDVSLRAGSEKLDNYRRQRNERVQFTLGSSTAIDDTPAAIRRRLWIDTDSVYRAAAERLIRIRTSQQVKAQETDTSGDFTLEPARVDIGPAPRLVFPKDDWADRVRKLSAEFAKYPEILSSSISVSAQQETKHFVTSEGTRLRHARPFYRIMISGATRASDGMNLATSESFESVAPEGLPSDDTLRAAARRVATDLTALTKAPVVEPFVGPAILSGRASGVFFHEIFGHRIEGHRQKDDTEGQTFTKSVGKEVLPPFLSVVFDPERRKSAGTDLNGWYKYDDEGVAGRQVTVVDKGILKAFLMSRSPIDGFPASNGHGRRQPGREVVSRQSNLIVESTKQVSDAGLRELLIEEIKRQSKPFGFFFRDITGGFTTTSRGGVQAFKVIPLVVYRVYPDGRPDELVRGVDIVGTPLASFAKILATSNRPEVFNGYCGAESGSVPVSAVSPAILVSEIEIEKKGKSQETLPLLPAPEATR